MKRLQKFLPVLLLTLYLGAYRGRLALYGEDSKKPLEVFPFPVSSYPLTEQQALEDKIPIRDAEELADFLEAYLS